MNRVILNDFSREGSRVYRHKIALRLQIRCALDPFDFAQGSLFASSG